MYQVFSYAWSIKEEIHTHFSLLKFNITVASVIICSGTTIYIILSQGIQSELF